MRTKAISISKIVNIIKHWWIAAIGLTVAFLAVASLTAAHFSKEFSLTTSKEAVLFYPEPLPCVAASQTINHVLLVGSDGLRADTFENLNHNTVRELTNSGFYTRGYVQTDSDGRRIEAGTDENIPAIISGKPLHGIYKTGNGLTLEGYEALGKPIPQKIETLFEVANRHNFYTGLVYSKSKAGTISNPKQHQVGYVRGDNSRNDTRVRNWAVEFVKSNAARKWYLFAWFSEPDYVQVGASDAYRNAVQRNLNFLADIIAMMKATCAYGNSIIALTSDHGMSDGNGHHGTQYWHDPRVYEVPWLLAAPGLNLLHRGNGPHYNHEVAAAASHLAWGALTARSDSRIWLEGHRPGRHQPVSLVQ